MNPFLKRGERKAKQSSAYWRAPKQEKELGKRFGARQTPGSGNKSKKGDLYVNGLLRLEAKSTSRNSFSVTVDMIQKIEAAGRASGEIPIIAIELLNELGKPYAEVAIIQTRVLEELIHALKNKTDPD